LAAILAGLLPVGCAVPEAKGPGLGAIPFEESVTLEANSQTLQLGFERFGVEGFHSRGITGRGVRLAVIDGGIDVDSPDLAVAQSQSFLTGDSSVRDVTGHGTKVASVIAARDNGIGLLGLAPDVELLVARVVADGDRPRAADVAAALRWSLERGADIVNLSIAFDRLDLDLETAIAEAVDAGAVVLAPAGSASQDEREGPLAYPAACPGVVAVSMAGPEGDVSQFALVNDNVDLYAPGEGILALGHGGTLTATTGVALATAYASGMAALELAEARATGNDTSADAIARRVQARIWNEANDRPMGH
jgi:subtilisin family serine protease